MPILLIARRNPTTTLRKWFTLLFSLLMPGILAAQSTPEIREILDRLGRLEQQNRALSDEVHQLRQDLAAARGQAPQPAPSVEDKVAINETRTQELEQTKVGSSQRLPIRITGMVLFNSFLNSKASGGDEYPTFAWLGNHASAGGTLRQTTIGLEYYGPQTFLGGSVHGSLNMDFWGGSGTSLDQDLRIRTGSIQIDWASRSIMAGLESPIFAPRQPASLAQVAFAPLSGAGNLWLWVPQVRFEQKLSLGDQTGIRAQVGMVETGEMESYLEEPAGIAPARPGVEGRFLFYHGLETGSRIEIAPGFHTSVTHVDGLSVPSHIFSVDWFARPWQKLEFSGAFFTGQNVGPLGGVQPGFTVISPFSAIPVHSQGGWAQLALPITNRLSFHLFSGVEDDRNRDLVSGDIGRNWMYGANLFYRLAPNVLLGLETSQLRTTYVPSGTRLNDHYDLALAYLF
jgi:type II secretory pathway component PulM